MDIFVGSQGLIQSALRSGVVRSVRLRVMDQVMDLLAQQVGFLLITEQMHGGWIDEGTAPLHIHTVNSFGD